MFWLYFGVAAIIVLGIVWWDDRRRARRRGRPTRIGRGDPGFENDVARGQAASLEHGGYGIPGSGGGGISGP